ncbi:hypothetical protein [Arthrobacter sp. SO3]|uniref:hypothetical protein n=1 Tax=Arthrobacter sp. SO3 TaxID=1897057 RepID=UPI001CFF91E2|nr:hypothetical protein [Arthrobacter sp. SO3]MCB5294337.1 hypothetical protein [Arthrobacter sp. SO3]
MKDLAAGSAIAAKDVYSFIETWWENALDYRLLERIAACDDQETQKFIEAWSALRFQWQTKRISIPEGSLASVPLIGVTIDPGKTWAQSVLERALRTLLICPRVSIDDRFLFPMDWLPRPYSSSYRDRPLPLFLMYLMTIRSFVEDGSIHFAKVRSEGFDTIQYRASCMAAAVELGAIGAHKWEEVGVHPTPNFWPPVYEVENTLYKLSDGIVRTLSVCTRTGAAPLASSRWERLAYETLLPFHGMDSRHQSIETLASLEVPHMVPRQVSDLARVRDSADSFHMFREALGRSVAAVGQLPESDEASRIATNIVSDELRGALGNVQREISKSSALEALTSGSKSFSLKAIGVGAVTLTMTQEPRVAVFGAAASQALDSIAAYVAALKKNREGKAIWGLVTAFDLVDSNEWADPYWEVDRKMDKARRAV